MVAQAVQTNELEQNSDSHSQYYHFDFVSQKKSQQAKRFISMRFQQLLLNNVCFKMSNKKLFKKRSSPLKYC